MKRAKIKLESLGFEPMRAVDKIFCKLFKRIDSVWKTSTSSASNSYHVSLYRNDGSLRYSGQMVGHQKEGWGTEFGTGGKIIYVGNWRKGKRHGHGTHTEYKQNKPCKRYVGK